jgi:hypothetical protein
MESKMKSHLSPARQKLLEIIQSLGFGTIEELSIVNGEPCFGDFPRILRDIKLGAESESRSGTAHEDFALKSRIIELFGHLDQLGSAKVKIEVKHSSAFRIVVEHSAAQLMNEPSPGRQQ